MYFSKFKELILRAHSENTLIKPKHDPLLIGEKIFPDKRSVISYEIRNNLTEFIESESYFVYEYFDNNPRHSKYYYEIEPYRSTLITPPSSGIISYATTPTYAYDRIIIIDSYKDGVHAFGELKSNIVLKELNRRLLFKNILKH